jgi:hypothetical protein
MLHYVKVTAQAVKTGFWKVIPGVFAFLACLPFLVTFRMALIG